MLTQKFPSNTGEVVIKQLDLGKCFFYYTNNGDAKIYKAHEIWCAVRVRQQENFNFLLCDIFIVKICFFLCSCKSKYRRKCIQSFSFIYSGAVVKKILL